MSDKKKTKKMYSAYTIVFIFLIITSMLTWIVPPSIVITNEEGVQEISYNSKLADGEIITNVGPQPAGLADVVMAAIKGFENASEVSIAILMAGAFLGIINYIGALDAGIGALLKRYTGTSLIAILMFVFAVFGAVFGFWEEVPAFSIVIIPLFVMAGYDVITGLAVLTVGATAGNMASIVNPFSVGAAIGAIGNPELSIGSGIILRIIIFIVLYFVGLLLTLRYANMVKKDKSKSIISDLETYEIKGDTKELPELTRKRMLSILVLVGIIVLLMLGYMPWYIIDLGDGKTFQDIINKPLIAIGSIPVLGTITGFLHITPLGDWYFGEFAFVFLVGALLLCFINKMSEKEFVREFSNGAKDLLGVVLVLSVANGISVIMGSKTEGMSVTFVYWIQSVLTGIPAWGFSIAVVLAYILIGFFLQSTSGVAGITMPILGAVTMALFQNSSLGAEGGQIMLISAYTVGLNFMSAIYPSATNMGTLELFKVPYDRYLKFSLQIFIPMVVIATLIIALGQFLGII